jgi:hypothetical protein
MTGETSAPNRPQQAAIAVLLILQAVLGTAFAQERLSQSRQISVETDSVKSDAPDDSWPVPPGYIQLRLVNPEGQSVAAAMVGLQVDVNSRPILGRRFRMSQPVASDENGELILDLQQHLRARPRIATCIVHDKHDLGAMVELSGDDMGRTLEVGMAPLCHVHAQRACTDLDPIGWSLQWGETTVTWRGRTVVSSPAITQHLNLWLPPGRYELTLRGRGAEYETSDLYVDLLDKTLDITIEPGQSELDLGTVDLQASRLAESIGRPAPELGPVKEWLGGPTTTLAGLKGSVVLLYFGGSQPPSSRDRNALPALHHQFGDAGLVIITLYDSDSIDELQRQLVKTYGPVNPGLLIALDAGERTVTDGVELRRLGPTHRTYGVTSTGGAILIDRTGIVVGQIHIDPRPVACIRQMLAAPSNVSGTPPWQQQFKETYRLGDGQVIKRIWPQSLTQRQAYYSSVRTSQGRTDAEAPIALLFDWDGQARLQAFDEERFLNLAKLIEYVLEFTGTERPRAGNAADLFFLLHFNYPDPEGPEELLDLTLPGDWVVDPSASTEIKIRALERLVAEQCDRPVCIERRTVRRQAIVATGSFRFSPVHSNNAILVFSQDSDVGSHGGETYIDSADSVAEFLRKLAALVRVPVIDRTEPELDMVIPFQAHINEALLPHAQDEDEKTRRLQTLLATVSAQTHLQLELRTEPVDVWHLSEATHH